MRVQATSRNSVYTAKKQFQCITSLRPLLQHTVLVSKCRGEGSTASGLHALLSRSDKSQIIFERVTCVLEGILPIRVTDQKTLFLILFGGLVGLDAAMVSQGRKCVLSMDNLTVMSVGTEGSTTADLPFLARHFQYFSRL